MKEIAATTELGIIMRTAHDFKLSTNYFLFFLHEEQREGLWRLWCRSAAAKNQSSSPPGQREKVRA